MQILLRNPFIKAILLSNFYLVPANTCTGTYLLLSHSNQYSDSIVGDADGAAAAAAPHADDGPRTLSLSLSPHLSVTDECYKV